MQVPPFNVIYAENDDMAKGAVATLDKANISQGVGKDVIVMGFDCNKWAPGRAEGRQLELRWTSATFPEASYIDEIIKSWRTVRPSPRRPSSWTREGFDATTITQEDVDNYGI